MKFAITNSPTPLLNRKDLCSVFSNPLPLDDKNLLRGIETIVLPQRCLSVLSQINSTVVEVLFEEYSSEPLYTDLRFLEWVPSPVPFLKKPLPSQSILLKRLEEMLGSPYIWGGNWHKGIPSLMDFYPSLNQLEDSFKPQALLEGVDCSGLLYEATEGYTPRNTKELICFGDPVPFHNLSIETLIETLLPLDLLVWRGHVVIVFDKETTIESSHSHGGVVTLPLKKRFEEILTIDPPQLTLRRWIISEIHR